MGSKKLDDGDEVKEKVINWLKEQAVIFHKTGILKLPERLQN